MEPTVYDEWALWPEDQGRTGAGRPAFMGLDLARPEYRANRVPVAKKKPRPHRKAVKASRKQDRARRRAGR